MKDNKGTIAMVIAIVALIVALVALFMAMGLGKKIKNGPEQPSPPSAPGIAWYAPEADPTV